MKENRTICDVCGAAKREVNHWWRVETIGILSLAIRNFDEDVTTKNAKDACGEACVHALVARWLATGSLEEQKASAAKVE